MRYSCAATKAGFASSATLKSSRKRLQPPEESNPLSVPSQSQLPPPASTPSTLPPLLRVDRQSLARTKKNRRVNTKCPKHPRRKQERHHTEAGTAGSAELSTVSAMETEDKSPVPGEHRGPVAGGVNGVEVVHETNGSRAAAQDGDMEVEDGAYERSSISKCHEDRTAGQRQRLPRRCKYWRTSEGCRAGSECKFRHDAARRPGAGGRELNGAEQQAAAGQEGLGAADGMEGRRNAEHRGDEMDTGDVDELVEGMKKISIPANLSFGRAARRGRPIHRVKR